MIWAFQELFVTRFFYPKAPPKSWLIFIRVLLKHLKANPEDRSPSPEPVYSSDGKRLNTRDVRTRRKLEDMRHKAITEMKEINPHYMPPADYKVSFLQYVFIVGTLIIITLKPPMTRVQERVLIPQDEHPGVNFVGLLIGPRGNTLKKIETENKCKVMIRGKGSVKVQRQSFINRPLPGEDEPLHALIRYAFQIFSYNSKYLLVPTLSMMSKMQFEPFVLLSRMQLRILKAKMI